MIMHVKIPDSLSRFLDAVKAAGRRNLFSVAANALKIDVQQYLMNEAPRRHSTAERLGGDQTGHLEKGAARITFSADADHGEVVIPIAGMSRAFGDVTITPKNWTHLTIPVHGKAYGHKVAELKRMGWIVFRPPAKGSKMISPKGEKPRKFSAYRDVILGHDEDGQTVSLYILKKRVQQSQDRSLLPSDEQINSTVARAMMGEIRRVAQLAG